MTYYVLWAPRDHFLVLLAQGWVPSPIEQPVAHHGHHSILLEREQAD